MHCYGGEISVAMGWTFGSYGETRNTYTVLVEKHFVKRLL
jgi:hypothetical protein